MLEILTWTLTALAILGVILNIYKKRSCFYVWAFTNFAWACVDFAKGIPAQGTLFTVYFILSVWGIAKWKEGDYTMNPHKNKKFGLLVTEAAATRHINQLPNIRKLIYEILQESKKDEPIWGTSVVERYNGTQKELNRLLKNRMKTGVGFAVIDPMKMYKKPKVNPLVWIGRQIKYAFFDVNLSDPAIR